MYMNMYIYCCYNEQLLDMSSKFLSVCYIGHVTTGIEGSEGN